jgi:diacylglycerol O-acyltransferase
MVPVNLRPGLPDGSAESMGNRFGLVYLDLPTDLHTAPARLGAMRARTAVMKQRPDAVATFGVLAALGLVPAIEPWATRFFSSKASVVITNVPGPREPLHLAGRRVDHAMFWVPHPADLGVGISVLSYAGELRIGIRADAAVMPDPGDLAHRFEVELRSLGAAAPARRRPVSAARAAPSRQLARLR